MEVARALLAAVTAMILVFVELDRTFYIPRSVRARVAFWWGILIVGNGIIAGICYHAVRTVGSIATIDP